MSTGISGTSASAFSSRRLPMKHQGHTTSETTSMRSAAGGPDEAGMTNLRAVGSYQLEHDLGKWALAFRKDHAPPKTADSGTAFRYMGTGLSRAQHRPRPWRSAYPHYRSA